MTNWNPRYVRWATVNGNTPEQQWEHDMEEWPGGSMTGFHLWIDAHRRKFLELHPEDGAGNTIWNIAAWDAYLATAGKEGLNGS